MRLMPSPLYQREGGGSRGARRADDQDGGSRRHMPAGTTKAPRVGRFRSVVLPDIIGILQKSDAKSDVGQRWQGLAGRGKSGSSRSLAITSPQPLAGRQGIPAVTEVLLKGTCENCE